MVYAKANIILLEVGENLLRSIAPNASHRCHLSTTAIEDTFRTARRNLDHGTRFRTKTDQESHWLSRPLWEAENGYRPITRRKPRPLLQAVQRAHIRRDQTLHPHSIPITYVFAREPIANSYYKQATTNVFQIGDTNSPLIQLKAALHLRDISDGK
ncbi:hypothetical protein RRSWK_00407 [Rhodopirellula sp. SWK7]|nr:hypothetical protein RRSWK_00407 [Rhodopirellula sp. SWK7]